MERHPKQLHVRMSDREMESAKSVARELGMTVSDLVRSSCSCPRGGARRGEARRGRPYDDGEALPRDDALGAPLQPGGPRAQRHRVLPEGERHGDLGGDRGAFPGGAQARRDAARVESLRRAVVELSGSVLAGLGR